MNTNDNGRAEARSRANHRWRRLTLGTAMLGVVTTGTLGWLDGLDVGVDRYRRHHDDGSEDHDDQPHGDDDDGHRPRIQRRLLR